MELFGRLFLLAWCGVFGRRGIIDALKTLSVLCPTSSFFLSKPYLTGSLCGETILFLFWIYLTFVIFVLDLFSPVYSLCAWVSLFLNQWILITYQKKKKNVFTLSVDFISFFNYFLFFIFYFVLHLETNWYTYIFYQLSDALRTIMREEGWSALYRGIIPGLFLVFFCLLSIALCAF